jgi:hypothetical protein
MSRISFSGLVSRIKQLSKTAHRRQKIEQLFQVNNRLRRVGVSASRSAEIFTVYGRLRPEVADQWVLVGTAAKSVASRPAPLCLEPTGRFNREYLAAFGS